MDTAESRPERSYFCRSCHMVARGRWVPAGWYLLERAVGGAGKHLRLGVYCSVDCLVRAKDALAEGARRGVLAAETTDRDRTRLTEIARTMMHAGMTVRQAGDHLEIPTSTLRHWLREAGLELGPNGTLADQEPAPAKAKPTGRGSAVSALNELNQADAVSDIHFEFDVHGPPHAPTFACTAWLTSAGERRRATEIGDTKAAAKASAARALLDQVTGPS
jgi:hypothetical protein